MTREEIIRSLYIDLAETEEAVKRCRNQVNCIVKGKSKKDLTDEEWIDLDNIRSELAWLDFKKERALYRISYLEFKKIKDGMKSFGNEARTQAPNKHRKDHLKKFYKKEHPYNERKDPYSHLYRNLQEIRERLNIHKQTRRDENWKLHTGKRIQEGS